MIKPPKLQLPQGMNFPPFVILEGPDAAGKSTLAQHIAHRINAVVFHGASMGDSDDRPNNDEIMRRYHTSMVENITRNLALGHPVVCDRLWLSHVIYGEARRALGGEAQDLIQYEVDFLAACQQLGAFYIFTLDENCIANSQKHQDPDHPRDVGMMNRLLDAYKRRFHLWSGANRPVVRYDYTTDGRHVPDWLDRVSAHKPIFHR
jgi:thymidylate kinase